VVVVVFVVVVVKEKAVRVMGNDSSINGQGQNAQSPAVGHEALPDLK